MASGRLLIIEDEAQVRAMLRQMLERARHEVQEARDGNEGLRLFEEQPADLVITDLLMPEKEGLETIKDIRKVSPEAPIIAMLTPALILGVPLFDIAFVGIGRIVTGKVHSLTEWLAYTGRDHIHRRFEQLGLTKRQSVLLIFFLASTLGLSALLLKDATPHEAVLILVQAACVLAIVAVLEGIGRWRPRP